MNMGWKRSGLGVMLAVLVGSATPAGVLAEASGAAPAAPAAPSCTLEGHEVKPPGAVSFETGSATLTASSDAALAAVARYMTEKSYISTLRIEGHVAGGDAKAAQQLSEQRAQAVAKALVAKGVDCKRLITVGFGSTKPVASSATPEGQAANTRIVFSNAGLRGRAIGGMPLDGGGQVAGDPCQK